MGRTSNIKAVLWDMGGVILRTVDASFRKKWADRLKVEEKQLPKMVFENEKSHEATIGLISDIELWNWIYKQFKLSPEDGLLFRKEFFAGDRMDWELLKYIDHLRPAYSTGLLSNAWMDARQSLGTKYPGWDVFDYIFFSAEIHLMKPDPQIYQYATKAMKVLPKETIFVDDQPENVEAADRFGIHAIRFQNSEQAIRDVSQLLNS